MVQAKQVLDVHVSKGITRAQSNEHLRCRSEKAREYAMSKGNYDPTREHLNFEVVQGGKIRLLIPAGAYLTVWRKYCAAGDIKDPKRRVGRTEISYGGEYHFRRFERAYAGTCLWQSDCGF